MQLRRPGHPGRRRPTPCPRGGQRGATLVEVLVAMTLLSFALHTLVLAHATALRHTTMSRYRATAVGLAADMGERLRANPGRVGLALWADAQDGSEAGEGGRATGFHAGDYDYTLDFQRQQGPVDEASESCQQPTSACTVAQLAAADLAQWRQVVRRQLPAGAVFLQRQAAQAAMDVWVAWREPVTQAPDEAPTMAGECPEGLVGRGEDLGIRCVHVRIGL